MKRNLIFAAISILSTKEVSMKFLRTIFLFVLPVYLVSCATQHPIPNYLQNAADTNITKDVKIPELKIQKFDQLYIQVYSASTKPETSDIYYNLPSLPASGGATSATGQGQATSLTPGYLVDVNGNIEYPRLGQLHVEGLTKLELADMIKKKIPDSVLINPTVIVRFMNYRVTVLGEVGKTGSISFPGDRLTILEAVALAGGITDYGKKNNVKVIREADGKREVGIIDLSSKDLFDSPYYNLAQNDMVIVEPTKQKARLTDQTIVAQRISLALSVITAAAFIYNIFK